MNHHVMKTTFCSFEEFDASIDDLLEVLSLKFWVFGTYYCLKVANFFKCIAIIAIFDDIAF